MGTADTFDFRPIGRFQTLRDRSGLSPGDRARFWIPEKLAYKGQRGMPEGMLVFDIELIKSVEPQ